MITSDCDTGVTHMHTLMSFMGGELVEVSTEHSAFASNR